jgi:hypothetical protein
LYVLRRSITGSVQSRAAEQSFPDSPDRCLHVGGVGAAPAQVAA